MIGRLSAAVLILALCALSAAGQRSSLRRLDGDVTVLAPRSSHACTGGLFYDDGSFEDRYNLAGEGVVDVVQRFDLPQVPVALQRLCVCFTRTGGDGVVDFDLLVYAGDGPAAGPGTLLTGLGGLRAEEIPFFPQVAFYGVDLSVFGIELAQPQVYIGPSWDMSADDRVFLCGDENGPATRPVFYSTDEGGSWSDLGGLHPELRAVGVRAVVGDDAGGGFDCVPDATTLCLQQGRFQVRLAWRNQQGVRRDAQAADAGSDDSGLFYFLDRDNWEVLIKVLDGCERNGHFWVFFAAVTNVEYTLTVVDAHTGEPRTWTNPAGTPSPAVTDTRAFAACP